MRLKFTITVLLITICATALHSQEVSYIPKIDGSLKAKVEMSLSDGQYRFNVRNSRFGVAGNASKRMTYRIQVDFNNEGKVSILDSYIGYKVGGFDIRLGQQQYKFSSDLDRGPSTNMFANRSFLAKYLTSYYGSELADGKKKDFVRTIGSRDIGAMASYTFGKQLPVKFYFGVFNGAGSNNPEWGKTANIIGRGEIYVIKGLRLSASYYNGYAPTHTQVINVDGELKQTPFQQKMNMFGTEVMYTKGNFFIEGEYARRYLENNIGKFDALTAAHIHSYYKFDLPKNNFATHLAPIVRWDLGNGLDYLNKTSKLYQTVDINRITAGLTIGFGEKMLRSELRLNYEKYLMGERPSDYASNPLFQDKFTIEAIVSF